MVDKETIAAVKASYVRCCLKKNFFDDFYEDFINSDPGIAEKFKNTDMPRQKTLLEYGILMMILFAEGQGIGAQAMKRIATTHDIRHYKIEAKWYSFWTESLLRIVVKHDKDCTDNILQAWRKLIGFGTDYLKRNYI